MCCVVFVCAECVVVVAHFRPHFTTLWLCCSRCLSSFWDTGVLMVFFEATSRRLSVLSGVRLVGTAEDGRDRQSQRIGVLFGGCSIYEWRSNEVGLLSPVVIAWWIVSLRAMKWSILRAALSVRDIPPKCLIYSWKRSFGSQTEDECLSSISRRTCIEN